MSWLHARRLRKGINVWIAGSVGTGTRNVLYMENIKIKLFFDYPKRKDGFMGRENRRYWIIIIKTGKKIRITEKIFDGIQAS